MAYLKRLDRWPHFCSCMLASCSVRGAARALGLSVPTTFRWRHRLLDALRSADEVQLEGDVALAETMFPFSEKGKRNLSRPARRRGELFWWLGPRVWVVLARDAAGRPWTRRVGPLRPSAETLDRVLAPRLASNVTLYTGGGPLSEVARFARRRGLVWRHVRGVPLHQNPATAYGVRFRRWLHRFQGVATKYLPNYLVWHRFLEMRQTAGLTPRDARAFLLACAFPSPMLGQPPSVRVEAG